MKRERIGLSEHFTYKKLLLFTLPSVVMAVFTSIYTIVDGVFVSKAVGDAAFAGLNLIFPVIIILGAIGMMFGSGGSALIAKTLGEGDKERANGYFTFLILSIVVSGFVFGGIGIGVLRPVAELLGKNATRETVECAVLYGFILLCGMPLLMLQYSFQSFMITAEKSVLVLPLLWGLTGVWVASTAAEVLAFAVTMGFFWGFRKKIRILDGKPLTKKS